MPFSRSIVCCYLYPITRYGYPPPAEDTARYLTEMHNLGYRSVELEGIRKDHLLAVYRDRHDIRQHADRIGLEIPYFCAVLPGLSSPDPVLRDDALALFEKGCITAVALGAAGILDNGPLPPYVFSDDIPVVRHFDEDTLGAASFPADLSWSTYWDDLTRSYADACDVAAAHGLTFQLHPCVGVLTATTDGFLRFRDAVGRDNLRFNLDTANQYVQKDNLSLSLLRLADCIDYIHLSDNGGARVEHLVPGYGAIDWNVLFETLDRIGFEGHFGIDVGGAESGIEDIEEAYLRAAEWLEEKLKN